MDFDLINCFKDLNDEQQAHLRQATTEQLVSSGERLMRQGEPSNSMYFVVSGRFAISIEGQAKAIDEIGAGQTIGEMGFLSGSPRSATATAVRDSVVLRLARADYEMLCGTFPQLLHDVSQSLARKLTASNARFNQSVFNAPRTLTLCPAGAGELPEQFVEQIHKTLSAGGRCRLLRQQDIPGHLAITSELSSELTQWLNTQENQHQLLVYLIDRQASDWSALAMRQSDLVLQVADSRHRNADDTEPNAAERLLEQRDLKTPSWLVFCHQRSRGDTGCARWFTDRQVDAYHHVCLRDTDTFNRLGNFLYGTARGLVASGGGAYTAAHIGCFRAFEEAGIHFDIVGGASGGSAMVAAMAAGLGYEELDGHTDQMMVRSGALKKLTLPVYSLVDHTYFDKCLQAHYGDRRIEDNPLRFFAISANLSTGEEMLHDRGPFWRAVRASSAIPGLLPPMVADNGDLLVDGGILDSVPLRRMHALKHGPNIVLCFEPNHQNRAGVNYEKLPGRRELLLGMLRNGLTRPNLDMPGIGSVLTQSMLLNNSSLDLAGEQDLILRMALPRDLKLNDWHRHREIAEIGYRLTQEWLHEQRNHQVLSLFVRHQP